MNLALAYLTKDRVELSEQTWARLREATGSTAYDVFWCDGSKTDAGVEFFKSYAYQANLRSSGIGGGADAAIVYALTKMLSFPEYTHVGLCENDVLLAHDWFGPTMALFERGEADGLKVGAVSARAYEDRILCQRDGYALMHNLGAGHVCFTREAAELVLRYYRTGWWPDNRSIFSHLTGLDIGRWGCFRANAQHTTADWHFDAILAQHGLASLALTPSPVEMIGQTPSLAEQGLKLATEPVELLRDNTAFNSFVIRSAMIRKGTWRPDVIHEALRTPQTHTYFAHQMPHPTEYSGEWFLQWTQGFGPFSWRAGKDAKVTTLLYGPAVFLVSGGKNGAKVKITDTESGYEIAPELPAGPERIAQLSVPANVSYRDIEVEIGEGGVFHGVQTSEPQPKGAATFDFSKLPPVE